MRRPEQALQMAVAQLLHVALPESAFFTHVPNGGARTKAEGGILKAMGVKAGVPDLLIVHNGRAFFIELKAERGKLSPSQLEIHFQITRCNAPVAVCKSIDEVLPQLAAWGIPVKASLTSGPLRQMQPTRAAGGFARAASLSPERRREIARQAAKTRWTA